MGPVDLGISSYYHLIPGFSAVFLIKVAAIPLLICSSKDLKSICSHQIQKQVCH